MRSINPFKSVLAASVSIWFFSAVLLSTPSQAWLIYHKPSFMGMVIDAETKEPIAGAIVVIVYKRILAGLGPGWSAFPFDVRETLTDSNGIFQVPSYTTLMHPFSFNSYVNFIIFKPGYGNYPYNQIPSGIKPRDEEVFFSEDFGKECEIELPVGKKTESGWQKFRVPYGIVELPKLKTREERLKASRIDIDSMFRNRTPIFNKLILDEREALSIK